MKTKGELQSQVARNMTHHPPTGPDAVQAFENIRSRSRDLAFYFLVECPTGDDLEKAIDALELAQMYAVAAIARAG
jgi:hypothetical protein